MLEKIKGIGPNTAKILTKAKLATVENLLYHFPYRYEDYTQTKKISQLKVNESVTVKARLTDIQMRRSFKNKRIVIVEAVISDETGSVAAVWFNQPYLPNILKKSREYYFYGQTNFRGKLQLQSPNFEEAANTVSAGQIMPVYSLPDGISQKKFRGIIKQVLEDWPESDPLPQNVKDRLSLISLKQALLQIHFPQDFNQLEAAKKRLGFNELLVFQLGILGQREQLKQFKAVSIPFKQKQIKELVGSLPFKLTQSQRRSAWEIIQDLEKPVPMNRLLQGDVGSGKTVVAALAAASAAWASGQTAVLAPTEILAQQHYQTLVKLLEPHKISTALLTGSTPVKEKKSIYEALSKGKIDCVVGTHALLNDKVKFKKLNLLIVDEQHRFGVEQRDALIRGGHNPPKSPLTLRGEKEVSPLTLRGEIGTSPHLVSVQSALVPHLLSMTATPIPRTLALTLYGDLSISSITEMPAGRQKIKTQIIVPQERAKAHALIRKEILSGRQAFIIYPLVEESEKLEVKAATEEQKKLAKDVFPNFSVGLIHGRLGAQEKEAVMRDFKEGKHHLLVSTSVVEVGIDVPNATVMVIEGAERFGLTQLHQFRGRVGRGEHVSYCLLVPSGEPPERLEALCHYHDGFKLAELDLKFRGMGEVTGTKQSGFLNFKIADLADIDMVKLARREAQGLIDLGLDGFPGLKATVESESIQHSE